jgi:hypothetical protein
MVRFPRSDDCCIARRNCKTSSAFLSLSGTGKRSSLIFPVLVPVPVPAFCFLKDLLVLPLLNFLFPPVFFAKISST